MLNDVHVIDTLEALRALSDPLRLRILEALQTEALTATQIARRLDQKPNKLHYHLTELEKNGLVEMVEARQKGNLLEKYYRPVATTFRVAGELFERSSRPEALAVLYQQVITQHDITAADLKTAMQAGTFTEKEAAASMRSLLRWRLSPEEAETFKQRLTELVEEFGRKSSPEDASLPRAAFSMFFYTLALETLGTPTKEEAKAKVDNVE